MSGIVDTLIGSVRAPTLMVLVNGIPLAGGMSAHVVSTNDFSADRFSTEIALGPDPGIDAAFWAGQTSLQIEIRIAPDALTPPASLITGAADSIELDPIRQTVRVQGRDFAAQLIEARTQETFSNRTSSEIAQLLAGRHGLACQATTTTTPVGRYYENQHNAITLGTAAHLTTEWDLLVALAKIEGFDVFVQGQTLFFQPPSANMASAMMLAPADTERLQLSRALTLAGAITVTVNSWDSLQQTACVQTVTSDGQGTARQYVLVRPNLTADQAFALARNTLAQIVAHQWTVVAHMPGDVVTGARDGLELLGTQTEFDQAYAIVEIDRILSPTAGFRQTVRAIAAAAQSQ
jgi:prophage tail gpP-like protein